MNWSVKSMFLTISLVVVALLVPCQAEWVSARDGFVPQGAVVGGMDKGRILYICRSNGISGKIFESSSCYYTEGKKEISGNSYEVLTNITGIWISPVGTNYPCNMLKTGDNLYSCRIRYRRTLTVGKLEKDICLIPYGGKSHEFKKHFEVFTALPRKVYLNQNEKSSLYGLNGQYFTFQLKARDECIMNFGNGKDMLFRVAIGALKNSVVSIGPYGQPYKVVERAPNVLNSTDFSSYWIRWTTRNTLEFGRLGNMKPLARYSCIGIKKINSFQLHSTSGDSEWNIPEEFYNN